MGNKISRKKKDHGRSATAQAEWEKAKAADQEQHIDTLAEKMLKDTEHAMNHQGMRGTSHEEGISSQEKHLREEEELDQLSKDELVKEAKDAFHHANSCFREAQYDQAKEYYLAAIKHLEHCDHQWRQHHEAMALTNLGVLSFAQGRYEEAQKVLHDALMKHRISKESADPAMLQEISLSSLSVAIKRDIAFHRVPIEERELISDMKEHGNLDAMVADVLNNLGACNEVLGNLEDARKFYQESLDLRSVVFGSKSLKAAEYMQNLATILDSQGKYEEAEQLLSDALRIQLVELGEEHVETAVTMNNLAVLLTHLGQLERAEELLEASVAIRSHVYGNEHHLTNCARQNLQYVKEKRQTMRELERDFGGGGEGERDVRETTSSTFGDEEEREKEREKEVEREKENERQQRESAMYERSAGDVLRDAPAPHPPHPPVHETGTNTEGLEEGERKGEEAAGWKEYVGSSKIVDSSSNISSSSNVNDSKKVEVVGGDVFVDAPGDILEGEQL